jgi:hypothetical protein
MDLAARCLNSQEEVRRELLRICAMKTETRKSSNSRRIEEELQIDPETDTVRLYYFSLCFDWAR